ncbi:MAG: tryptophan--tRNA ligase [Candidatus Dependentiae bacterium]|nr:tryptophan--tRNA ligase [Candidatus Dependentiae bacterium]
MFKQVRSTILTGVRPTGRLHLGHYSGALSNWVLLQETHNQYVMIADIQALTDNYERPEKIRSDIREVALDLLAVGINPEKTVLFVQSMIPELAELTVFFLNLVTVARLQRNPTVKTEIKQKGFGASVPVGFFVYPVSQAADIALFKADCVPVGEDQLPMIEQTNEIVRTFNRIYKTDLFVEARALVPKYARLPGTDGKSKMGKSLGNAIYLADSSDEIAKKVMSMYTDADHLRVSDPGKIEGNTVFAYLDAFDPDLDEVARLKEHYARGGLGDVALKKRLIDVLEQFLAPIRARRALVAQDPATIEKILRDGSQRAREVASQTMRQLHAVMGLFE